MHIEEIRPGLSRIEVPSPTLPPATCTNAWMIGKKNPIIIDPAGVKTDVQFKLHDLLKTINLRAIVLTHHHKDHIGGVRDLQDRTGSPIWASEMTSKRVDFPVQRFLNDGEVLEIDGEKWQVMITPGHAKGHVCLYSSSGKDLIAGDMVAGIGTILIAPPEGDLEEYLNSLSRLKQLDLNRLMPAHGPTISPARPYLQQYIDHRNMRTEQIRAVLRSGPQKSIDITKQVYSELPKIYHPIAEQQILCHLDWLIRNSEVSNDAQFYQLNDK